jgi:hypothetical protein
MVRHAGMLTQIQPVAGFSARIGEMGENPRAQIKREPSQTLAWRRQTGVHGQAVSKHRRGERVRGRLPAGRSSRRSRLAEFHKRPRPAWKLRVGLIGCEEFCAEPLPCLALRCGRLVGLIKIAEKNMSEFEKAIPFFKLGLLNRFAGRFNLGVELVNAALH